MTAFECFAIAALIDICAEMHDARHPERLQWFRLLTYLSFATAGVWKVLS